MYLLQRITFFVIVFFSANSFGQFGKNCELRQFKINILNPGLEYEMALGVNTTFDIKAGMQITIDPRVAEPYTDFGFSPAVAVQYRYYYNFASRQRNHKQIYGNSANYIGPAAAVFVPGPRSIAGEAVNDIIGYAGLVTGLQRSFNSGFNFSFDVGAGYYFTSSNSGIYPIANLSIGWILSEKRWCVGR